MNNIKDLIEEATTSVHVSGPYYESAFDEHEFAELILKRVIEQISYTRTKLVFKPGDEFELGKDEGLYSAMMSIKNYFDLNIKI